VQTKSYIQKFIPIHKDELPKFLCMSMMIFLILYFYHSIRLTRETLIISHLGAEAISATEMLSLPISILFTILYIKLSDILTRTKLFHTMIWFFISYFVLFAAVLYPNHEALTIPLSPSLTENMPSLRIFFKIIANWHHSLFFILSHLSITILMSISFWQTANHITSIEESKRFYPLFSFSSFFGLIIASFIARQLVTKSLDWQSTLNKVVISVVASGLLLSLCIIILGKIIGIEKLNSRRNLDSPGQSKDHRKLSFKESLRQLITSKPILLITVLLLCYNIPFNLSEGVWKKTVEIYFNSDANQIHYFMSKVNLYEGAICMAMALLSSHLLRSYRWKTSALLTPIVVIVTTSLFYFSIFFSKNICLLSSQMSVLKMAVFLGACNMIGAKSMKNTIFDSTKEIAFIPLSANLKTKGKAAAEMIGIRIGKGSGAVIQQTLLMTFTNLTLMDFAPVFFAVFVVLTILWIFAINSLDNNICNKVNLDNQEAGL
jgi:ATP:ADP antiporter, AAA family